MNTAPSKQTKVLQAKTVTSYGTDLRHANRPGYKHTACVMPIVWCKEKRFGEHG